MSTFFFSVVHHEDAAAI